MNQPIGIAHQMATEPNAGANKYASTTRRPKEITVKITEIPGFPIPR